MTTASPGQPNPHEPGGVVTVDLGPRSYPIRVVSGGLKGFGPFAREVLDATWAGRGCSRALIVTDTNLAPWASRFVERLQAVGIATEVLTVAAGEASKSLNHAAAIWDRLVAMKADRHACVVALGGGVVGDLAGFAAATYARGLPLLMVPTSLLAQVDSAVGGKVGVNHPKAKNIIGAFHQPVGVWIDAETLDTLPTGELRCGLAEVVKYGVILDGAFFATLEGAADAILRREPGAIQAIIRRSCELKAEVVSRDEREQTGLRAVLNFGHTIGHAIEAVAGYDGAFRHGEAVAVGMVAESRLAEKLGWVDAETTARIAALLDRFGLPTVAPGLDPERLLDAMGRDKKNRGGRTRFVLPRRIGEVELTDAPSEEDVRGVLGAR